MSKQNQATLFSLSYIILVCLSLLSSSPSTVYAIPSNKVVITTTPIKHQQQQRKQTQTTPSRSTATTTTTTVTSLPSSTVSSSASSSNSRKQQQQRKPFTLNSLKLQLPIWTQQRQNKQVNQQLIPSASSTTSLSTLSPKINIQKSFLYIQIISFLITMSSSMVALLPVQIILQLFQTTTTTTTSTTTTPITSSSHFLQSATQYLSFLTTIAAMIELSCSSYIGQLLDHIGRKIILLYITLIIIILQFMNSHFITNIINIIHLPLPSSSLLLLLRFPVPINYHLITISLQKFFGTIMIGFFLITIQTIITDLVSLSTTTTTNINNNKQQQQLLSTMMGQQMAITGFGFLFGISSAGIISSYLQKQQQQQSSQTSITTTTNPTISTILFSIATIITTIAYCIIQFLLHETHSIKKVSAKTTKISSVSSPTKNNNNNKLITPLSYIISIINTSLLSCIRLLTHYGSKVRMLSILLMIMTLPMFMGDFFQIYAKTEWNLSTTMFSTFLSLFAITGIMANICGSIVIRHFGIRTFTLIAIISKIITSILTLCFGYQGTIIGLIIGFLGNAQSIGIVATLISQSGTTTINHNNQKQTTLPPPSSSSSAAAADAVTPTTKMSSQGVMAGERASLIALLKVIGPILYSTLYIQGQSWFNTSNAPFIFNIILSIIAFIISYQYL